MKNKSSVANLRKNYSFNELNESDCSRNPFIQFSRWFNTATESDIIEPNAMAIATSDKKGFPSVRMVLLKGYDKNGFKFFTNYLSRKSSDLKTNPNAALLFYWDKLERQIRIEGKVKKLSQKESAEYFSTRPLDSKIAAWASIQSFPLKNKKILEDRFNDVKKNFNGKKIPLPPFWGGYILMPKYFEFWQGRPNRLHDRIAFIKRENRWERKRLSP